MSEGSTEKGQYVNIENYLSRTENSSWADETEEDHERETKPRAWATVTSAVDDAPDLAAIQAEEEKKSAAAAAEAAKRVPYRAPQKSQHASYESPERNFEPRYDRAPREKQPVPTEPPFTAFIGNLAYDIEEEDIREYFGELGVVTIRLLRDNGKSKGFGYIEFKTADGLTKCLMANEAKLKGRSMNLDVAKPQQSSSNTSWGSSGSREKPRPSFNRDRDTTWGPGPGGRESFNKDRPSSFNRPPPPSAERPKLNLNPPKTQPTRESTNKPSNESIFGVQITPDQVQKMDKLASERIKREIERESQRDAQRKEQDKRDREKSVSARSPRGSGRGDTQTEERFTSSWRKEGKPGTAVKAPYNMNYARREDSDNNNNNRPEGSRGPQKSTVVDSEGFRGQSTRGGPGHNRGWENQNSLRSQETKNQNPKENQNKYASLEVDEEEE